MFHFNVDLAVECVKSICINTQCVTCDKLIGPCVRFPCGHSVCESCAQITGECLVCIASPTSYEEDKPQTSRLNNVAALLTAFQNTFDIDVSKRQRISDHLKVEKLVFPECIQAPHKYSNKRKSSNISVTNKENLSLKLIPGEEINNSNTVIMKKSVQYVQNWLNQHEGMPQKLPRRPFGDININTQTLGQKTKQHVLRSKNVSTGENTKQSTYRKRSYLKSKYETSSLLVNKVKSDREIKIPQRQLDMKKEKTIYVDRQFNRKCEKNESGIVLDDEQIDIEEVDTDNIDKDKQAWLAVLEAARKHELENKEKNKLHNEETNNSNFNIDKEAGPMSVDSGNKTENIKSEVSKYVPFYKNSSLFETCKLCNNYFKIKTNSGSKVDPSNEVSIVINNSAFITTIKFMEYQENKKTVSNNKSVAIQTDKDVQLLEQKIINFNRNTIQEGNSTTNINVPIKKMKMDLGVPQSLDVFATDKELKQNSSDNYLKQKKCLIIEDSDTDSNISCNNTHEIIVDVHRPNVPEIVECGILRSLEKNEYEHKTKRQKRGRTPNSSNSSDKENLDPNRKKKIKLGKKHKNKK